MLCMCVLKIALGKTMGSSMLQGGGNTCSSNHTSDNLKHTLYLYLHLYSLYFQKFGYHLYVYVYILLYSGGRKEGWATHVIQHGSDHLQSTSTKFEHTHL